MLDACCFHRFLKPPRKILITQQVHRALTTDLSRQKHHLLWITVPPQGYFDSVPECLPITM